jgi:Uma2 family endonuclease
MATITKLLTAEEYALLSDCDRTELIDGVVVEVSPPGGVRGHRQLVIGTVLRRAELSGAGHAFSELGCTIRRDPDLVRAPDLAFIRKERIGPAGIPKAFWEGAPDLAVEIVSPWDRPGEIQTKIREWIEAGARQVWVVYEDSRTVHVICSLQDRMVLNTDDTLDGGDAVPGFSCQVAELFA